MTWNCIIATAFVLARFKSSLKATNFNQTLISLTITPLTNVEFSNLIGCK